MNSKPSFQTVQPKGNCAVFSELAPPSSNSQRPCPTLYPVIGTCTHTSGPSLISVHYTTDLTENGIPLCSYPHILGCGTTVGIPTTHRPTVSYYDFPFIAWLWVSWWKVPRGCCNSQWSLLPELRSHLLPPLVEPPSCLCELTQWSPPAFSFAINPSFRKDH